MERLFGTDGIRGIAGREPVTAETAAKLGRAVVHTCKEEGKDPSVIIGRDTRGSGEALAEALSSGVVSAGGTAYRAGILPTPGVAFLTRELRAGAGVMVSASHNPYEYNGFKVFGHRGFKFSDEQEAAIEKLIQRPEGTPTIPSGETGRVETLEEAVERYVSFIAYTYSAAEDPRDMKIILDCANGATYRAAPMLFERLGAETETLFALPDGRNINKDCGSEHPETLRQRVMEAGADAGLAFDGDGDRVLAVDEEGRILRGDHILAICAKMLKEKGSLTNNRVVSTVMSNMGLRLALRGLGIDQITAPVGDRHVTAEMGTQGACLGGEESGHIIFFQHHTTGDGLLSALQLLSAVKILGKRLSELATLVTLFPQILINVPVASKREISDVPEVASRIKKAQQGLGENGRVLVRYSGTEPLCRIMVEAESAEEAENHAEDIADAVRKAFEKGTDRS
jgi:phosphoglucosamine mutase